MISEGEGEVASLSAKRSDRRNRADLIESATPCDNAQLVRSYHRVSNPLRLNCSGCNVRGLQHGATTPSNGACKPLCNMGR